MLKWILLSLGFCILFYRLYLNGYLIISAKRALTFIGSARGKKASFSSCSGKIKWYVRFKENQALRFSFACELTKGEVTAELYAPGKELVLSLSSSHPTALLTVSKNTRYTLIIRFQHATGSYSLSWE